MKAGKKMNASGRIKLESPGGDMQNKDWTHNYNGMIRLDSGYRISHLGLGLSCTPHLYTI